VHRAGLTPGEEARAYQAMLDLGVKATEIARQTGQPRRRVLQGLDVAKAGPEFGTSLQAANLTLDQAAAVAACADDPDVTATLIDAAAASGGAFRHALSRAKQDRTRAHNIAAAVAALTAAGVTVTDRPEHGSPAVWVDRLDHHGQPLNVEAHQSCPGHAGYVRADSWSDRIDTAYGCIDPAAHGHTDRYASSPTPVGQPARRAADRRAEGRTPPDPREQQGAQGRHRNPPRIPPRPAHPP